MPYSRCRIRLFGIQNGKISEKAYANVLKVVNDDLAWIGAAITDARPPLSTSGHALHV